ncbi:hypothetical protein GHT06_009621 [Daphnia sinensis]|uniref:Uncharacterized protein n=1 Tax=Daphnia sinensis TaxID=1820382 RepID=A0AAD5LN70_9CRUS|nr:hypothetical protein GHT06_009621 [Daphnia sinensis]
MGCLCGLMGLACCGAKAVCATICSVLGSVMSGIGVGFAVVAGGVAVVNAFASGALVTVATAVIAYIGIRFVIRCLR